MKRNLYITFSLFIISLAFGCRDNFERMLQEKDYEDVSNVEGAKQKVLYLIVDGARGVSVRDLKSPNITSLTRNATYSWNAISDDSYNNATSWADMMTGVGKDKHKVVNSSMTNNKLYLYPTFITRIKSRQPKTRVAAFSASQIFRDSLTVGANVREAYSNDNDVKNAVINELAQDSASVVVGLFSDVNKAGETSAFDLSSSAYKTALQNFDDQLGQILNALRSRKEYANENWLIVVTSSRGGTFPVALSDGTIFSNAQTNTFTIFSNDKYKIRFIDKPFTGTRYEGNFVRLNGINDAAIRAQIDTVSANTELFNFGTDVQFTIELKVKKANRGSASVPNYDYASPVVLSKKASKLSKTGLGWAVSLETKTWQVNFGNSKDNNFVVQAKANSINDGNWHTLAFVVVNKTVSNVAGRYVRIFTDGVFDKEAMIPANFGPIDIPLDPFNPKANYNPLTLGFIPGDLTNPFNGYISDVRIWRAALTDATISQFSCDTYVNSNHPNYSSLAGFWPCTDGSGGVFKDMSVVKNDFIIKKGDIPLGAAAAWEFNTGLVCPVSSTTLATMVPNSRDVASQILSWLAIPPVDSWKLDGRVWLNQ